MLSTVTRRPLPTLPNIKHLLRFRNPIARAMSTFEVLPASELNDGQLKEVEVGGGKILLSKLNGKVYATSATCTHYGAPLAKGVLSNSGRVVCPWHGACFNVKSGDIEDGPGLDALHSYKAEIKDGKIVVTADEEKLKSKTGRLPCKVSQTSFTSSPRVVIVGGGAGAIHTIESLREHGFAGAITVLSSEEYPPIDRTKISKALIGDAQKLLWRDENTLKGNLGVELRLGTQVAKVDTTLKTVTTSEGEQVKYDTLVLATGGWPRKLPVDGVDLKHIHVVRRVDHGKALDSDLQEGKHVVIVGSSFISMEVAVAASKRTLASLTVVGMEEYPFEAVLGKEVGAGLKKFHESQGVRFIPKQTVERFEPSSSDSSAIGAVILKDGTRLPADVAVLGIGVAPQTAFLKESGFNLEQDQSLSVDKFLKVKGQQDVFAVGDIATYPQKGLGEPRRIEHWNVASNHGRAVGQTIAGKPQPFEKVPIFWSAQGQQLRYVGVGAGYDEVHIDGNLDELNFVAYYAKQGKIVAVASMQRDPIVSKTAELLRLDKMPSLQEIKGGKDPLTVDIASAA